MTDEQRTSDSEDILEKLKPERGEPGEPATLQDRFLGALIDGLIAGGVGAAITTPLLTSGLIPFLLSSVVAAAIAFGVFIGVNFNFLKDGQTLGKRIMKTRVLNEQGNVPELNDLLIKRYSIMYIAVAVPYVGPLLIIGNALMIFRDSRNCFHDDLSKTKVVNV